MRFRKRPIVVDAEQFKPGGPIPDGMKLWPDEHGFRPRNTTWGYIDTLEGRKHVQAGDWIITGANGERYLCKPGIFAQAYEAVE